MTPARRRRLWLLALGLLGVGAATALGLQAFQQNLLYYYTPSQVEAGEPPAERQFRIGGLVERGSVERAAGSLTVEFMLTDMQASLPVSYTGVLPDLFREGQGVIARGQIDTRGVFVANEVLAKHDENYMPPEVAERARAAGHPMGERN